MRKIEKKLKRLVGDIIGTLLFFTGIIFFMDFDTAPMSESDNEQETDDNER